MSYLYNNLVMLIINNPVEVLGVIAVGFCFAAFIKSSKRLLSELKKLRDS